MTLALASADTAWLGVQMRLLSPEAMRPQWCRLTCLALVVLLLVHLLGPLQVAETQHALCLPFLLQLQCDQAVQVYLPCFSGELLPPSAPGP